MQGQLGAAPARWRALGLTGAYVPLYYSPVLQNTPKRMPIDFGRPVEGPRDFSRAIAESGLDRRRLYHNLPVYGACTRCKTTGSVDIPIDFNPSETDKMMAGKIVKVYCERCRNTEEFRPLTPKELSDNQFYLLRRNYEIYKKQQIDGRTLPPVIKEFVDEYEKRLNAALNLKGLGPAAPHVPSATPKGDDEKPPIITP